MKKFTQLFTNFLPLLFAFCGLFGVNVKAWATWPTYSGSCSTNGYALVQDGETHTAWTPYEVEYDLAAPGETLTFKAHKTVASLDNEIKVYQYVNGAYENNAIYTKSDPGKVTKTGWFGVPTEYGYEDNAFSVTLNPLATKIKFVYKGSLEKYIKEVRVTRASGNAYALYNDNLDCGSADYNAANSSSNYTTGTAYVDWSHIATEPTCTITGSNAKYFEIKSKSNKPATNKYGAMSIVINYKHTAPGDHSATLNVGGKTITITGHTNKITPYIVTTPTVDTITYGQTISNSQLGAGLVKADLINAAGTVVPGTWTIDENGQTVSTSGGQNTTVNLTFTPSDQNTYNVLHTTQTMFVRSASMITWASAYSAEKPTIPVGKTIENAATTTAAGATITYSTSDPTIIEIGEGGTTFKAIAEGEATITASHGVTPTHGAASAEKTFKTTYKDIQVIVWNDRFDRLTTEMTSKNLLAEVWIENPSTGVRTYSAARTALLEYSVEDNTVVSIPENSTTLTIHKKGNTTITASVEGNDQYESASVTMEVKVREPSAGCEDPILLNQMNDGTNDYLSRLFSLDTDKPALYTDAYTINVAQGQVPDKLLFSCKGELFSPNILKRLKGKIKAQERIGYSDSGWQDIESSKYIDFSADDATKWYDLDDIQVSEGATAIRFYRPQGGEGYHYVRNVEVTMKHFIRTETPTVDFGNTIKVNSSEYKDVVVKYSNAKGSLQVINPFTKDVTVSDEYIDIDSCGAFGSATLRIFFSPTTATMIDDYIVVKDPVVGNSSALSIRVKANVQRADQTIDWSPETNISTIDQILLNGTTNGQEQGQMNAITYTVTNNDGVISVSNNVVTILKPGTVTITASQNGSTNYAAATSVVKNFTISAEPLTLVAPEASNITYGQTLSESELTGGSAKDSKGNDVGGTFAWQAGSTMPNASDDAQGFTVEFTPSTNAAWYTDLTTTATINVAKATPTETVKDVVITYGTKASSVELDGTGDGTWSWNDDRANEILDVNTYNDIAVKFTPNDDDNYNVQNAIIKLTVNKIAKLEVEVPLSFCAGESETYRGVEYSEAGTFNVPAEGATRDTVYVVKVTVLQPTTGTDSKTITYGDNESWNEINLSGYAVGSHSVVAVLTNAVGCDSTVTLTLTVTAPIINEFTNATGDGDWSNEDNWTSVPTGDNPNVIVSGDLEIAGDITVGNLTIEKTGSITVITDGTLTVTGESEDREEGYGDLYVANGGEVEVVGNLKVGDLVVEASIGTSDGSAESGQVVKAENIVYANAYIEINMDPSGVVDGNKWYGFTVPFEVNARNGISRKVGSTYQNCSYGTDYIIAEYDAAKRLSSGKGWKYLSGNTLNAGQFYYFGGDGGYNTYRFKASGNTYTPITEKTLSMNGTGPDANWNAVGNSTLQHATASFEGGGYVQVYQNGLDAYKTVATNEATFVVGCPFFIQASESATLALSVPTDPSEKYYAPRRVQEAQTSVLRINLTAMDGGYSDQIYVSGVQKEQDGYVLGHDLSKAGLSTEIPQLWVDAYGQKLSVHEAALYGNNAYCTLGLYAPKSGEYLLTAAKPSDNTQIFLTIDGMPVWNITESDYVVTLNKGTNNSYGLMIMNAPRVTTGIDSIEDDNTKGSKMMIDGLLYILKNGQMYDATGKKIK